MLTGDDIHAHGHVAGRGESAYVLLSLVAKSLLAWQVFANTLVPS